MKVRSGCVKRRETERVWGHTTNWECSSLAPQVGGYRLSRKICDFFSAALKNDSPGTPRVSFKFLVNVYAYTFALQKVREQNIASSEIFGFLLSGTRADLQTN